MAEIDGDELVRKQRAAAQAELDSLNSTIKTRTALLERVNATIVELQGSVEKERLVAEAKIADVRKQAEADMEQIAVQVQAARQGVSRVQQEEHRLRQDFEKARHTLQTERAMLLDQNSKLRDEQRALMQSVNDLKAELRKLTHGVAALSV